MAGNAVQNSQSEGRWVQDRHSVEKVANSVVTTGNPEASNGLTRS